MPRGSGKYSPLLKASLSIAGASQGMLIVIDGTKGPGAALLCSPKEYENLIAFLLSVVGNLRADLDTHTKDTNESTH
jgi:hypothetical protein